MLPINWCPFVMVHYGLVLGLQMSSILARTSSPVDGNTVGIPVHWWCVCFNVSQEYLCTWKSVWALQLSISGHCLCLVYLRKFTFESICFLWVLLFEGRMWMIITFFLPYPWFESCLLFANHFGSVWAPFFGRIGFVIVIIGEFVVKK